MASVSGGLPDFAALFPVARRQAATQMTPRIAHLLYVAIGILADQAYDEVDESGDVPVTDGDEEQFSFFARLPALSWRQASDWRRHMARAADDLCRDLEAGDLPRPRCNAEELVLDLALEDAEGLADDQMPDDADHQHLPTHQDDYAWDVWSDDLFEDHDVLMLYDEQLDGVPDPSARITRHLGVGDLGPTNWFTWFGYSEPRSTERGFRR